jgi:signal transduction histidine kinase
VELKIGSFSLSDKVLEVLAQFQPICDHEGYELKSTVEPDQYVMADEAKITQVLYNFIGNAVNYVGADKLLIVKLTDLGSRTRFEVTDHGSGISEEELPFIWQRYYKAKSSGPTRKKVGTGLGLAIAKEILELHSARYGVDSAVGQGTTFWFELNR